MKARALAVVVSAVVAIFLFASSDPVFAGSGGEQLFKAKCASCHGQDGTGNAALAKAFNINVERMNLAKPAIKGKSDAELSGVIKSGKGGLMPSWAGQLSNAEIHAIVQYLRSIGK